uniref:F-box domain-containing protein n=2 Tax=Caenorhabditis tropicalis TaxID=1561998 RepID=A0A1I7TKY1_9PELO
MAFPLLKLPSLAYEQVLLNFHVSDLVDFSLLSSRCQRIIQSIRFPFTAVYVCATNNFNMFRLFLGTRHVAQWNFQRKPWKKELEAENELRQIGGIGIRIQKTPRWVSNHTPAIQMKVAYDYVQSLFHLPVFGYSFAENRQKLFPQALGITKCDELRMRTPHKIPNDELKYVLEKVEVSKVLILDLKKNDDFECCFVQFSMDKLEINQAFWITKETFLAMDCARIQLEGNGNLPIQEFVSQWLSSRSTRFESLKMTRSSQEINWNEGFKTMKWNPAIRGRNFMIHDFKKLDCHNGIDILRDDGLLATVVQKYEWIYFVVWHKRFQPEADRLHLDYLYYM